MIEACFWKQHEKSRKFKNLEKISNNVFGKIKENQENLKILKKSQKQILETSRSKKWLGI